MSFSRSLNAWGLDPPRIEAVVVALLEDLAVPELEPDGEVGAHLGIRWQRVDLHCEVAAPENLERHIVTIHNGVDDVEFLGAQHLLPFFGGVEERLEVA